MRQILTTLAAAGVIAGCASPSTQDASPPTQVANAPQQFCTRETPIGSNIPVTRCRTAEQIARDAEASRAALDAVTRPMAPRDSAGGAR